MGKKEVAILYCKAKELEMQLFVIAIVYTLLLSVECQNEGNSNTAVNGSCSCGNTYTYTVNVGEQGVPKNSNNDEVKEAVKSVMEELLRQKMDEMLRRLEAKNQNATEEIIVQMKTHLNTELRSFATELKNHSEQKLQDLLNELESQHQHIETLGTCHLTSCKNLPAGSSSGYYLIYNSTGHPNRVYCDMTRRCGCNSTGGWTRVAFLNMTDPNQQCPDGLRLITSPKRTCGRSTPTVGCASVVYQTFGHEYSHVCGRIRAYQYGRPEAFDTLNNNWLVDGITLYTHNQSQHIWSFAAGYDEISSGNHVCPCNTGFSGSIKATVGQDYFCDTGSESAAQTVFYSEDPLWDGEGCGPRSTCCSFNNPPWFCKQLPQSTTDDIEIKMCGLSPTTNEDTPFDIVEIYVQ